VVTFIWPFSAFIIGSTEYTGVGGFLRFSAFFALLVAAFVLVILPIALSPLLTQTVRDMGLRSDSLAVTLALFDPTIVLGKSRSLHLSADDVDLSPATAGSLDLTLGDVSFVDRTWRTIDGQMDDVSLTTGGQTFAVDSLRVTGPAEAANATARLTGEQAQALIRYSAQRQGVQLDDVAFTDHGVRVRTHGVTADGQLQVRGGALVLSMGSGLPTVPLIQPAPSDPWRLDEAWISDDGLNVRGTVDTTQLAHQVMS
jgi:hypothetical protein